MAWTKVKTAIIAGTAIVLATGTTVVVVGNMAACRQRCEGTGGIQGFIQ